MGNGSLFLADLKLAGVLSPWSSISGDTLMEATMEFSLGQSLRSTANCPSVFDAQTNYLNQKLLTVDVEPKHIRTKTYLRKLVTEEILQSDGQSSIIIIGGANMIGWPKKMIDDELEIVRNAGVVQLQREIPYSINIQVAKRAVVQVILTWEKWIPPIPNKLLDSVDILQQKETELCRLTGMPTETF
ncbi:hypothetical protein F2Q69_00047977 [Brassica cretica]|uniref:Uncharacterized protein n=1 Tax=Brassica cretica TaxID=69181 RepID=A0A8S9PZ47_BRACR|nr:hypothetical protein F2Q69_00047977 [Brassica cretica]